MNYRAVGNRCAVHFDTLQLPIPNEEALRILKLDGFKVLKADMIAFARRCVGKSGYRRGAQQAEVPYVVDCSSFVKWLYGQRGLWLPRYSIQQRAYGESVELLGIIAGDLIFTSGWRNYFFDDPEDGVGHVGIVTEKGTIIHATDKGGVMEVEISKFIDRGNFRGARRYIQREEKVFTLEVPGDRDVETADDLRWIVLQSLPLAPKKLIDFSPHFS